ncbi:LutC/YkgG family protein [Calidifontibacillus erzurumensis]|uniref:LutC/YkgG family protein n=1 Tax=Calidifontibacillus erzurumensis TaxID=2741433 RepID=UPI0035B55696
MKTGTIHNRETFLNNIAKQLGRDRRKNVVRPEWKYNPQLEVYKDASQDELLEIFKNHCKNIHTAVYETNTNGLEDVLNQVIAEYEGQSIITWDDKRFAEFGLTDYFQNKLPKNGKRIHVWDPSLGTENINFAKTADIGITFSDFTLAESGTVVLFSDKKRGRSVSLLPKTYIAIVPKSTIVPRMTQACTSIHKRVASGEQIPSAIHFISGPSNSADIEMVLVVGVHGPMKATYIVVNDK